MQTRSKSKSAGKQHEVVKGGPEQGAPCGGLRTSEGHLVQWDRKPEHGEAFAPGSPEYLAAMARFKHMAGTESASEAPAPAIEAPPIEAPPADAQAGPSETVDVTW